VINHAKKPVGRVISTDQLLVAEFFGIIQDIAHTASEGNTMQNGLLMIWTMLALTCVGQAKDKPASAQNMNKPNRCRTSAQSLCIDNGVSPVLDAPVGNSM
jgi:hypothetical protein